MTLLKERVTRQASDTAQANTLRVFHEVARALTANLELEPLLRTILKKMEEFFYSSFICVLKKLYLAL